MPRPLLFCLKSGRSVCYSVPDNKNIQAIRYQNKLTQDQVIAKLNLMGISMSKSTYAKLETNRMNIKVSELVALAKIFHTDINTFFSGLL